MPTRTKSNEISVRFKKLGKENKKCRWCTWGKMFTSRPVFRKTTFSTLKRRNARKIDRTNAYLQTHSFQVVTALLIVGQPDTLIFRIGNVTFWEGWGYKHWLQCACFERIKLWFWYFIKVSSDFFLHKNMNLIKKMLYLNNKY